VFIDSSVVLELTCLIFFTSSGIESWKLLLYGNSLWFMLYFIHVILFNLFNNKKVSLSFLFVSMFFFYHMTCDRQWRKWDKSVPRQLNCLWTQLRSSMMATMTIGSSLKYMKIQQFQTLVPNEQIIWNLWRSGTKN
jgi:hypothetical protein